MNTHTIQTGQHAVELPIGYRFVPTDEELVTHYLRNKIVYGSVPANVGEDIGANSFYGESPPYHVAFSNGDEDEDEDGDGEKEWYFFIHEEDEKSPRKRNESPIRTVGNGLGFWKKMGEKTIFNHEGEVSAIKYQFSYFHERDTIPKKSHWRMDEYQLPSHIYTEGVVVLGKLIKGLDYDIF